MYITLKFQITASLGNFFKRNQPESQSSATSTPTTDKSESMETQLDSPAPSSPEESLTKPVTVVEKPEPEVKKPITLTEKTVVQPAETEQKQSIGNMFGGKMFSLPQVVAAAKKEQAQPTTNLQQQQQQKPQQETTTTTSNTTGGGFFSFFKRVEAKKPEVKKSPVQVRSFRRYVI